MITNKLDIQKVNFDDIDEIIGFAMLIFACTNYENLLTSTKKRQLQAGVLIIETARTWIKTINTKLKCLPASDKLKLRTPYNFVYMAAFYQNPDATSFNKMLMDIFDARIHGDTSIDEYNLYFAIDLELNRRNKLFFDKPFKWHSIMLNSCWKNFNSRSNRQMLSDYDTIQQVSILLEADLFMYASDQTIFKKNLVTNNKHYLDNITNEDIVTLNAIHHLYTAAMPYLGNNDINVIKDKISQAVINNPAINIYYKEAIRVNNAILKRYNCL